MMHLSTSIDSLIRSLGELGDSQLDAARIEPLLRDCDFDPADIDRYTFFAPGRYTRNLIYRNATFEVLALCWAPGSGSAIHDHGGRLCFMKVHRGALEVENYRIVSGGGGPGPAVIAPTGTELLATGDLDTRSSDRDIHRVAAANDAPAISIHVYAAAIDDCLIFDLAGRTCRRVLSRYDTVRLHALVA